MDRVPAQELRRFSTPYTAYKAWESGVDAFTIIRIAGHNGIVVSQRYNHPTPEAAEGAFERLQRSGEFAVIEGKRLPPATVSATLTGKAFVSF